jgi:hypothetical protein
MTVLRIGDTAAKLPERRRRVLFERDGLEIHFR